MLQLFFFFIHALEKRHQAALALAEVWGRRASAGSRRGREIKIVNSRRRRCRHYANWGSNCSRRRKENLLPAQAAVNARLTVYLCSEI
jgi:hypothetical protein